MNEHAIANVYSYLYVKNTDMLRNVSTNHILFGYY